MRTALLLLALLSLPSCISAKLHPTPAFHEDRADSAPERSHVYRVEAGIPTSFPASVRIASAVLTSPSGSERTSNLENKLKKCLNGEWGVKPDYVILEPRKSHLTGGTTDLYHGFGIGSSIANRDSALVAHLYRVCPARIGFETNEQNMVLSIDAQSNLREIGLQEGDTILSVDGVPYDQSHIGRRSRFDASQLSWTPGGLVEVVWVRPGEGRLSGAAVLYENRSSLPEPAELL